jgi:hypothetical protein
MMCVQENEAEEVPRGSDENRRVGSGSTKGRLERSNDHQNLHSEREAEGARDSGVGRIVGGALKREANSTFLAGEIKRATSFLPLITYTERLAETSA